ncbi:hypothetical protein [Variovorax ginsengisoli]|uniref:AraC family transcriptional regulator n=1 Tax=Variovorax ginsengisoli TaxID=363844 RepID=A0ABT8SBN2_9BURK|nr:hypothetical protein [Variovorax ginsengisoli]MDN8617154.1 hypothetical protein [Variovorax ginsengisoli]MDO1536324.1 hypothetical protein [Variovorax ginsengisoli]
MNLLGVTSRFMTNLRARFQAPVDTTRPRGTRLIEAYSAKLQRRVRLFDHSSFAQWIRLEADPTVITFCERPVRIGPQRDARLVDFWMGALSGEEMLLLEPRPFEGVPSQLDDVAIRVIVPAELAAASVWISNWSCMLPVINATRNLVPRSLLGAVLDHVCGPISLGRLEHELSVGDPSLIRGAIFEQLRNGRIRAPSLHTKLLSLHAVLEPAS